MYLSNVKRKMNNVIFHVKYIKNIARTGGGITVIEHSKKVILAVSLRLRKRERKKKINV